MRRALTVLLFFSPSALLHAGSFTVSTNVGGPIPAVGTGGVGAVWPTQLPADPAISQITLPHEVASVTNISITGLAHPSAGELHAALRDPNGIYYNLFVRSGFDGLDNWNQGNFFGPVCGIVTQNNNPFPGGPNNNIGGAIYTQDFGNTGTPPAPWPNGNAGIVNTPLNQIWGPAGTWSLVLWDWESGNVGSFTGWSMSGVRPSIETICLGDGTGLPCPCGNSGAPGHGCNNSSNTGGAILTGSGTFTPDTIVLTSTGERPTSLTIFVQGGQGVPTPFGDGVGCLAGLLKRLYVKSAVGGVATAPEPGDLSISARSAALGYTIPHGEFLVYQAYYRDVSATFCPGATFNVSSGLRITWP
ncbi:MAG: hypothetical protein HZA53_08315 [Planctomycetes bacterium]|nr:hypothetical protein [Planctomycetota bacterium]